METLVTVIRSEDFGPQVISENKPLLLLCMPRNEEFPAQLKILECIAGKYSGELKVGVLEEESIEAFKRNYHVIGTPTFLVLVKGKERGRALGLANEETLTELLEEFFPEG